MPGLRIGSFAPESHAPTSASPALQSVVQSVVQAHLLSLQAGIVELQSRLLTGLPRVPAPACRIGGQSPPRALPQALPPALPPLQYPDHLSRATRDLLVDSAELSWLSYREPADVAMLYRSLHPRRRGIFGRMWGGRRGGRGNHSEDKSHEDKSHEDKMGLEVLARVGAPPVYVSSPESDAQCYLVEYRPPGGHGGPLHWLRRRLPLWRPPREERGRSPDKVGSRAICARGTTSALDWACDARVDQAPFTDCTGRALPGVRVHAGFYAQMVGLFGLVDAGVRRHLDRGRHLLCCGHSLGGAVAMLAALNYGSGYPGQVSYAGFGTPRVGNRAFAAEFDRCVRGGLRVRNRRDPVPCLIPEVSLPGLEYVHGGREVRLGTREEVEEVDEEYAWGLDDGGGQLLLDAQDHRIEAYVMRLRPVPGIYPVPGPPFKSA